jgi:hypothetical protein
MLLRICSQRSMHAFCQAEKIQRPPNVARPRGRAIKACACASLRVRLPQYADVYVCECVLNGVSSTNNFKRPERVRVEMHSQERGEGALVKSGDYDVMSMSYSSSSLRLKDPWPLPLC